MKAKFVGMSSFQGSPLATSYLTVTYQDRLEDGDGNASVVQYFAVLNPAAQEWRDAHNPTLPLLLPVTLGNTIRIEITEVFVYVDRPEVRTEYTGWATATNLEGTELDYTQMRPPKPPTGQEALTMQAARQVLAQGGELIEQQQRALADTAQTGLRVTAIADQVEADAANILDAEHVPNRADLDGKLAKTYIVDDENVKLRWNGTAVVPGSETQMLATAAQMTRISLRGGETIYASESGLQHGNSAEANSSAIATLVARVNAVPNNDGLPVVVELPAGELNWDVQARFERPVLLRGAATRINDLCPPGKSPIVMGPAGLDPNAGGGTWRLHRNYWAENLVFVGGRTSAGGIYWEEGVTVPKARFIEGFEYGNPGSAMLIGQAHNWDFEVFGCGLVATQQNNVGGFVWVHGAARAGVTDYGQSRLRLTHSHVSRISPAPGPAMAIKTTGVLSEITHSKLEGSNPVHVIGAHTKVIDNYFEVAYLRGGDLPTAAVYYGDASGPWGVGLELHDNYANLHHTDLALPPKAYLAAPIAQGIGLQHARIGSNIVGDPGDLAGIVHQYDLQGQIGNRSWGNRRVDGTAIRASMRVDWVDETESANAHEWLAQGASLTWDGWALSGPGSLKLRSVQGNVRDLRWDETLNGGAGGFKMF